MVFKKVAPFSYKPVSIRAWLLCVLELLGVMAAFYIWSTQPFLKEGIASVVVLAWVLAWIGLYVFIASKHTGSRSA